MASKKKRKQGSRAKSAPKRKFPLWAFGILGLVAVGIGVVLYQSGWLSGSGSGGVAEGAAVGAKAPDFQLPDLSGKRYALADYIGKKPVLVEFIWTG
ncbi:MAG: redoxin domain-containing protein [Candidatus Tectomicrobia bacterium]|uniref:Redoxin domain-containing protein n=1 Tax=Tectimicrobiota bacterium TaxID=2528274 RepID=A0A932GS83_UNCTE|nr:redoxin domain-containing protein [Candidatus Tectomicrobia bacterium]